MRRLLPLTSILFLTVACNGSTQSQNRPGVGSNCKPCQTHDDCGNGWCVADQNNGHTCAEPCADQTQCPFGYQCYQLSDDNGNGLGNGCQPANSLSCPKHDGNADGGNNNNQGGDGGNNNNNQNGPDAGNMSMAPDSGVPGPPSGFPVCTQDTWSSYAAGFINDNCLRCHADYSSYSKIEDLSASIRRDVVGKTMPKDATLSNDQITQFVRWVDCDMPP